MGVDYNINMDRTLICLITGKKYKFSADYFNKKVADFGDVDTLKKYFITKRAKSYIYRGYGAAEIRNILGIDSDGLEDPECQEIRDIISYYRLNNPNAKKVNSVILSDKTDEDVAVFINNIKGTRS